MMMCYLGDLVIILVGDQLGIIQGIIPIMFPSDSVFEARFSHKTMPFSGVYAICRHTQIHQFIIRWLHIG